MELEYKIKLNGKRGIGKFALVDEDDFIHFSKFKWHCGKEGYAMGWMGGGRKVYLHRMIMNAPDGLEVDHINRIRLDNKKSNLRICTQVENKRNARKKNRDSQYHGIRRDNTGKKWIVTLRNNEENPRFLGTFTNEIAAVNARNYYAKIYHKEFALINDVVFMEKEEWEKYKTESYPTSKTYQYKGVRRASKGDKWQAYITYEKKQLHIGHFQTEIEAAIAYNRKSFELFGDVSLLNNVEDTGSKIEKSTRDNKTSKFRGVHLCSVSKKKWIAEIYHNGKDINIGRFNTEIEAAKAYNEKAIELKGDKAKINIIGEIIKSE